MRSTARTRIARASALAAVMPLIGLVAMSCAVDERSDGPVGLDGPALESEDYTYPDCCWSPDRCWKCIGDSYCNACECHAPDAEPSTTHCSSSLCPPPRPHKVPCILPTTWAKDPVTGLCCNYTDPCSAPTGWPVFTSYDLCVNAP